MFDLDTDAPPTSPGQLRTLLAEGVERRLDLPEPASPVIIEPMEASGAEMALERLALHLNGGLIVLPAEPEELKRELRGPLRPPTLREGAQTTPGPTVSRFKVRARPLRLVGGGTEMACQITADAEHVAFAYGPGDDGRLVMTPVSGAGRFEASVDREEFLSFIRETTKAAAATKGVALESVDVALTAPTTRSIRLEGTIRGHKKIAFFSASFAVDFVGEVEVDDDLTGRFHTLRLDGHGKVMDALLSLLEPKLQQIRESPIELRPVLGTLVPAGLGIDELCIESNVQNLRLTARFGAGRALTSVTGAT